VSGPRRAVEFGSGRVVEKVVPFRRKCDGPRSDPPELTRGSRSSASSWTSPAEDGPGDLDPCSPIRRPPPGVVDADRCPSSSWTAKEAAVVPGGAGQRGVRIPARHRHRRGGGDLGQVLRHQDAYADPRFKRRWTRPPATTPANPVRAHVGVTGR
jgi:hypothetical protein